MAGGSARAGERAREDGAGRDAAPAPPASPAASLSSRIDDDRQRPAVRRSHLRQRRAQRARAARVVGPVEHHERALRRSPPCAPAEPGRPRRGRAHALGGPRPCRRAAPRPRPARARSSPAGNRRAAQPDAGRPPASRPSERPPSSASSSAPAAPAAPVLGRHALRDGGASRPSRPVTSMPPPRHDRQLLLGDVALGRAEPARVLEADVRQHAARAPRPRWWRRSGRRARLDHRRLHPRRAPSSQ